MNITKLMKKSLAVLTKGPATARNMAFSRFDYWPVRRLTNPVVRGLPVYCVSLVREQRRRMIMARQAAELGLEHFELIDAVVGADLDPAALGREGVYDDKISHSLHERSLSKSEIAASLSHGHVYDLIVERGHEAALVVEDDCLFIPARMDRIDLSRLPNGWDIVFLNSFVANGRPRQRIAGSLYQGDAYTGSTAAYLLSAKGAKKLADRYKPVVMAADGLAGSKDLSRYMYYPDCALNGSVCYYYNSAIDYIRPKLRTT